MDFKKLSSRSVILISIAGVMLLMIVITRSVSLGLTPQQIPPSAISMDDQSTIRAVEERSLPVKAVSNTGSIKAPEEDDSTSMKEMKEQMDNDRLQQKKIKMLKLQLEQTNLQLEQEKALSEISKLAKENTSVIDDTNVQGQDKYPDVKVIYIGGSEEERQAILSINGSNYSVKEKNKPIKNMEVVSISDSAVVVHFNLPQDLNTTIEYKPD